MSQDVSAVLNRSPVMPVLVIDRVEDAVPLAQALKQGGITALEVTLRTPAALASIERIAEQVEGVFVGAGTVTNVAQFQQVEQAGGQFMISPGATATLLQYGRDSDLPYLPAVSTVSEMMSAMEQGYEAFKFFPASAIGGSAALKAIGAPFPQVRFCPTGGISASNFLEYLALDNVSCVGGSWVAPANLVREGRWSEITALAKTAVEQAQPYFG